MNGSGKRSTIETGITISPSLCLPPCGILASTQKAGRLIPSDASRNQGHGALAIRRLACRSLFLSKALGLADVSAQDQRVYVAIVQQQRPAHIVLGQLQIVEIEMGARAQL